MPLYKSEICLSLKTFAVFCMLLCSIPNLAAKNPVFNESSATGDNFGEREYSKKEIEPRYFVPIRFGTVVPARQTTLPPCATPANCCRRWCPETCGDATALEAMRCVAASGGGSAGLPCYLTTTCPQCTAVTCPATGPVPMNSNAICPLVPPVPGMICVN